MKTYSNIQLLSIVFTLLFLLDGCKEKPKDELPHEQSIKNMPETHSKKIIEEIKGEKDITEENTTEKNISRKEISAPLSSKADKLFHLGDHNGFKHAVSIENEKLLFKDIPQPVVILNFFSTWSLPCQGEAPYLADLQKKYEKELFVLGILLHPDDHLQELETFIQKNNASFFISSSSENDAFVKEIAKMLHLPDILPIPLTIIYKDGHPYRYYEGAVPVEMIEHDIKSLLKQ
ncbi:TlpA family protein disulfide reductase [Sulfurovum sp. ST-21]|uniref:Redoxin domain-containing protein n=1 Tax=Sulfurovum indicum TaxID=2779528 RepID=A0A7M1S218_9BACT|nr:redoxin domain-containing protein [Sulfurovum indicum]QOR61376.1 redoxin domain-containing protein [Sulfurovum indicum]